jgi:hypothetical protein
MYLKQYSAGKPDRLAVSSKVVFTKGPGQPPVFIGEEYPYQNCQGTGIMRRVVVKLTVK